MSEIATNNLSQSPQSPGASVSQSICPDGTKNSCRHCGVISDGEFCCSGCEAVFNTLNALGLNEYYRWREAKSAAPAPLCDSDAISDEFRNISFGSELTAQYTFEIVGIHCAGCLWLLERISEIQPGIIRSSLNASTGELTVLFRPAEVSLQAIVRLLVRLGYPPRSPKENASAEFTGKKDLLPIGVAGFAAMNTMMLAVSLFEGFFTGIDASVASVFRWVSLALSLPAVLWAGLPLYRHALKALAVGKIHIELPMTIAIFAAFVLSAANTFLERPYVYYDSVCLLIFLLLVSRLLQERALRAARRGARIGWALLPAQVQILDDGRRSQSRIEDLVVGDFVIVSAGERVPADGVLVEGESSIDRSILTGESRPESIREGAEVSAGALNLTMEIVVRVTAVGDSSRVGKLIRELRQRDQEKGELDRFTDFVGRWYLVGLAIAAVATVFVHRASSINALEAVLTLFIVTCPCALAFSVPTLYGLTIGAAARQGILVKSQRILNDLVHVRSVFLDKTGTLTEGNFQLRNEEWYCAERDTSMRVLATMTSLQPRHPVSRALRAAYGITFLEPLSSQHVPGRGVEAQIAGDQWRLGAPGWAGEVSAEIDQSSETIVFLARNEKVVAKFTFGDRIKNSSAQALRFLSASGRSVAVLSGDRQATVFSVVEELGAQNISAFGSLNPEEKAEIVAQSKSSSVFIGDGVNDVLALRAADIGIALAGGLEATVEAADVVLSSGSLEKVVELWLAAERTRRVILFSLFLSLVYNVTAAGITISGGMNPLVAAFLMPTSSLAVISLSFIYKPFHKRKAA